MAGIEEIEALFAHPTTIDLYADVISKGSFWPTNDTKKHLGGNVVGT